MTSETTQRNQEPVTNDSTRTGQTLLEAKAVSKKFGGVTALDGVDLSVREGEIVGLVGPNGAGKTTLFNCIMGDIPLMKGKVLLKGEDISNLRTSARVKHGITRTNQIARVFGGLSVRENMAVHQDHVNESFLATMFKDNDEEVERRIASLLEFVGLEAMKENPANDLSTGQKRLLNIACALLAEPDIILLDEPTAGVNPGLVNDIIETILELNEQGTTFLVIEHDMDVIRELSKYLYVLADATNLIRGDPEIVLNDERVLEAYFGR
jgi:branched-chain amino acid transport system ATP-binding protein